MPTPDFEKLESLIHRHLRALPERPAPPALESRVLLALARQAALPWWRRSFVHWPAGVRYLFILALAAVATGILAFGRSQVTAQALSELALRFPWVAFLQSIGASLLDTGRAVFNSIPPVWLYGLGALLVVCYGGLLGLGAALYRAFYRPRRSFRPLSS
jgi:hypothetical protein